MKQRSACPGHVVSDEEGRLGAQSLILCHLGKRADLPFVLYSYLISGSNKMSESALQDFHALHKLVHIKN